MKRTGLSVKQKGERAKRKAKQQSRGAKPDPQWLQFEQLVAQVQKNFSPDGVVTANDKIFGHQTEKNRQIDVSVRQRLGAIDLLIVIDAKDYGRKIDVKHVEEFIGLVEDVAASKGVMVTAKGYTAGAKKRAKKKGIDLLVLLDSGDHPWRRIVELPAFCEITYIDSFNLEFSNEGVIGPFSLGPMDLRDSIFDLDGKAIGSIIDLLFACWERGKIPFQEGHLDKVDFARGPVKVPDGFGGLSPIRIKANVNVKAERFFGTVPLAEAQGMRNELNGRTILNKAKLNIDMNFVQSNWAKVNSPKDVAVSPAVLLSAIALPDKDSIRWQR